jgi:hypothetical protein
MRGKQCPYCESCFVPRRGQRQKTCGSSSCQKALKKDNNARWREKNFNYCRGDYPRVIAWLDLNPGYLRHYRQTHPAYVENNRRARKLRDRQRKPHLDIQAKIKRQHPEIIDQLWNLPDLDIQDEISLHPKRNGGERCPLYPELQSPVPVSGASPLYCHPNR